MFGGLYNIVFTDYKGGAADLHFLADANWLKDAAVTAHVYPRQGRWQVALVFAWVTNPYRFVCRYITDSFDTEKKASLYADFYKRTSQKDKRGTLTVTIHDFMRCFN
jgi:hypothetical protein